MHVTTHKSLRDTYELFMIFWHGSKNIRNLILIIDVCKPYYIVANLYKGSSAPSYEALYYEVFKLFIFTFFNYEESCTPFSFEGFQNTTNNIQRWVYLRNSCSLLKNVIQLRNKD